MVMAVETFFIKTLETQKPKGPAGLSECKMLFYCQQAKLRKQNQRAAGKRLAKTQKDEPESWIVALPKFI